MILFDPTLDMAFQDYGIMLPIMKSRAERVFRAVQERRGTLTGPLSAADIPGAAERLREGAGDLVVTREDLERVHDAGFVRDLLGEGPEGQKGLEKALLNAYELIDDEGKPNRYEPDRAIKPLTALFDTVLNQVRGTYTACRIALSGGEGFCYYLGGGMHHARYDSGAGFCVINDLVIAARKIQAEGRAKLIWIVDVDAHKGDGSAELVRFARDRGELGGKSGGENILTLSIHMAQGWPLDAETLEKAGPGRAPLIPSDVEIPVNHGEEPQYIEKLTAGLRRLEDLSPEGKPDLIIVVDGADPYENDGLPSSSTLTLTLEQCLARDRTIFDYVTRRNIPSAWVMAGGYGDRAWEPPAEFLSSL
ncbi:histone deacetylase [Breznakiella homolactica]|uniref:Histone deacetylase n=1 Tax=Breznakiella homolactica TaxID=2798577 RepID=A0A7T7XP33_9SPIR|nr:histone deacetylase [Breznakiella homolactica]QQO09837.1 histone deacetylase [Breznakiella homolactica]